MIPFSAHHACCTLEAVDVVARGEKGFQVANVRLRVGFGPEDPERRDRRVVVEATHEARKMVEAIPLGSVVIVHGNAESREWKGRWFTSIKVETIARVEAIKRAAGAKAAPRRPAQPLLDTNGGAIPAENPQPPEEDDVPF